jgi:CRISPR/Cas system-associated exonuclease Cas4 (RecB family)
MNKPILIKNSLIMQELKNSLFVYFNKERDGIHVSDINLCLRETVFRRIKPESIKDREVGLFTVGRAIHDSIQTLAKSNPKYEIEKEINYEIDDGGGNKITLKAHIDLYDKENNIPIEAKTVRSKEIGEPKSFQVEQLQMYMTLTNADVGYILYQLLLDYNHFPFKVFEVRMTKEERATMLDKIIDDVHHLKMNLDNRTPENTRHIALNQEKNWKCTYCKYLNECYDMRVKNT